MKSIATTTMILFLAGAAPAAEITSNGAGGGPWSEPATWRGKVVPKADDEVILIKGDVIVFDRNDEKLEKGTCKKLSLDPSSVLKFKTGAGKIVFKAGGPIESYGLIKIDASTQDVDETLELHLVGTKPEERLFKQHKGGSLQVMGKDKAKDGKKTVKLWSYIPFDSSDNTGKIEAGESSAVDLQNCEIENVQVYPSKIDNTGAKPGERINMLKNRFVGTSTVYVTSCDTPIIADNVFEYTGGNTLPAPALVMNSCPLAEVKNNTVRGYSIGIMGYGQEDGVTTGNVVEKARQGINWYGVNAMLKNNTVRECETGFHFHSMSGAMEDAEIDKCQTGILVGGATLQLATILIKNTPKGGDAVSFSGSGEITLINCDLKPEQIKLTGKATGMGKPLVTAYQMLVVKVDGAAPAESQVELATVNPVPPIAPGAIDLNIRNNPAPLVRGQTPLPQTLQPLIVKSWLIDNAGKPVAAPQYMLKVLAPTDKPDGERKVLKTQMVKPDESWFRAKPNDLKPTVEVSLK